MTAWFFFSWRTSVTKRRRGKERKIAIWIRGKKCWTFRCANIYLARIFSFSFFILRISSSVERRGIFCRFFYFHSADVLTSINFTEFFKYLFYSAAAIKMHSHYANSCFIFISRCVNSNGMYNCQCWFLNPSGVWYINVQSHHISSVIVKFDYIFLYYQYWSSIRQFFHLTLSLRKFSVMSCIIWFVTFHIYEIKI